MLEAEWAFFGGGLGTSVEGVCGVVEACLRGVVGPCLASAGEELDVLWKGGGGGGVERRAMEDTITAHAPWTRMTYTEAIKALEAHHGSLLSLPNSTTTAAASSSSSLQPFRYVPKWGRGLQSEHERWLAESLVCGPVFVTDYPRALKPFYMRGNGDVGAAVGAGAGAANGEDDATVACMDLLVPHMGSTAGRKGWSGCEMSSQEMILWWSGIKFCFAW